MEWFTASRENGLLRLHWAPDVFITHDVAVRAARTLEGLSGGQPLPILVNITGVTGLAAETRAGMNAYRGFAAVALVGDHPVSAVVAAFARQSVTPTEYFSDEPAALEWLAEQGGQAAATGSADRRGH